MNDGHRSAMYEAWKRNVIELITNKEETSEYEKIYDINLKQFVTLDIR